MEENMFGKKTKLITLVLAIVLVLSQVSAFADAGNYALSIGGVGVGTELKLTMDDLKAMPAEAQIEDEYIYNSKTGEKTAKVKGVSLSYLLSEKAKVVADNAEVIFEASDGYSIDPQNLIDIKNSDLKYVLAFEIDGEQKDSITIYRKQKETGEFGTVFKYISNITIGEAIEVVEEPTTPETPTTAETPEAITDAVSFTDITDEYKFAEEAINALVEKGVVKGMGNGLYMPQEEFTRAQFCTMMVMGMNLEQKDYTGGFSDIASGDWHAKYVQAAVEAGLFKGNTDGTFLPDKTITRQEMASVAARAAVKLDKVSEQKLGKFVMDKSAYADKADVAEWAASSVAWLEAEKVFVDVADENFEPAKNVNRAEAAVVVFRTLFK
jgi:S-layer family protein